MPVLPSECLSQRDTLVFRLVRQHGPGNDIANRIDPVDVALVVFIDHHTATIVFLNADCLKTQAFRERHTAD